MVNETTLVNPDGTCWSGRCSKNYTFWLHYQIGKRRYATCEGCAERLSRTGRGWHITPIGESTDMEGDLW